MTTHDQHTDIDSPHDEAPPATAGMQPETEHTAPTRHADPAESTMPSEPSPVAGEVHNQTAPPSDAPSDLSAAPTKSAPASGETPAAVSAEQPGVERETSTEQSLFAEDQLAGLRARWDSVQAAFVDDPKQCVQKADGLVSDLVDQLTAGFADARSRLEEQWARGEQVSTEDLRVALKHYREFFERLLAA